MAFETGKPQRGLVTRRRDSRILLPSPEQRFFMGLETLDAFWIGVSAAIVEFSEDAIIGKTLDGVIVCWNESAERLYGYSAAEVMGKPISLIFPPYLLDELNPILARIKRGERIPPFETTRVRKDGTLINVSVSMSPIKDASGKLVGSSSIARDITERKRAAAALRESVEKFRTLAETIAAGVLIYQGTQFCYVNRAAEEIAGYSREELLAMNFWDIVHPDFREVIRERGLARLQGGEQPRRYEAKIITKQGQERWVEVTAGAISLEGKPAGLATAYDITERKQAEERARHLAVHDPLTDLANYRRLIEVLDAEIKRSDRSGRPFALLLLDLDGLKQINDTYGHLVGSRALCRLADVLRVHSRVIDTAARYGGDEFALVLLDTEEAIAQQVARRIAERVAMDGETPTLSVSVGVAVFPRDGQTVQLLLATADRDLYRVKRLGREALAMLPAVEDAAGASEKNPSREPCVARITRGGRG